MPYGVKGKGKYQARRYGRRQKSKSLYGCIPLIALTIFAAVAVLSHTGLGRRLEEAVAAAAQNDSVVNTVIRLVLPEGHSAGDAPPAALAHREEADATTAPQTDEPGPPVDEDALHMEDIFFPDGAEAARLPEPLAFESVLPGLEANRPDDTSSPVSSLTISGAEGGYEGSGTVYMRNETKYKIDAAALLKKKSPVKLSGDGVQVLIMHTHGTEAYTPDSVHQYEASDPDRTTNLTRNVVRVGDEIQRILTENGIKVAHSQALNDYPAYNGSYNRALEDITKYVKDNPSIKVVIDVHRDAMVSQNGTKYKTVAQIDGKSAAQLMFVAGTNEGGLKHDNWQENLTFQLKLHDRMNTHYPGIMRPINIRTGRFNQHVTLGSMLLEVGTSGNTLAEALLSARLFAQELADMLNGK